MQTTTDRAEALNWTREFLRSGITMEQASDDHGLMDTPGTWYRVSRGENVLLTTRSRGDALRLYQRTVLRFHGVPACEGHNVGAGGDAVYCNGICDHPALPFTVAVGNWPMYFDDRERAESIAAEYGVTVTVN